MRDDALEVVGICIEGPEEDAGILNFTNFDEAVDFLSSNYGYEGEGFEKVKRSRDWEELLYFVTDDWIFAEEIMEVKSMNIKNAQEAVALFHDAFKHPVATSPQMIERSRQRDRYNWLMEEVNELLDAKTVTDVADAITDIIYIALGTAVEHGIDIEPVFTIVQDANMAKLGPDGEPMYHPNGKIAKPDGWQRPEPLIEEEIKRQMNAN